jgi:hypothetical protein
MFWPGIAMRHVGFAAKKGNSNSVDETGGSKSRSLQSSSVWLRPKSRIRCVRLRQASEAVPFPPNLCPSTPSSNRNRSLEWKMKAGRQAGIFPRDAFFGQDKVPRAGARRSCGLLKSVATAGGGGMARIRANWLLFLTVHGLRHSGSAANAFRAPDHNIDRQRRGELGPVHVRQPRAITPNCHKRDVVAGPCGAWSNGKKGLQASRSSSILYVDGMTTVAGKLGVWKWRTIDCNAASGARASCFVDMSNAARE